jgi:signal transduction histidine kinase
MEDTTARISMNNSTFFRRAFHNLRNPIVVVKGYTALMLDGCGGELTEEQQEWVADMKKNSDHLLELINALSELSFLESGLTDVTPSALDLVSIVKEALKSFSRLIEEKKLQITTFLPDAPLPLTSDELLVTRVFKALIQNAMLYTPLEGSVEIALCEREGEILFSVKDNGPGMEQDWQVFEGFYRGESPVGTDYKGTGLSLLISKTIAERLGGFLACESSSSGSMFTLTLRRDQYDA